MNVCFVLGVLVLLGLTLRAQGQSKTKLKSIFRLTTDDRQVFSLISPIKESNATNANQTR